MVRLAIPNEKGHQKNCLVSTDQYSFDLQRWIGNPGTSTSLFRLVQWRIVILPIMDFLESMRKVFGDRLLTDIDAGLVADYRNYRKAQPPRNNPARKVKGVPSIVSWLIFTAC